MEFKDETEIKNDTDSMIEKISDDKKEKSTLSKLGVFALLLIGISAIVALIVLTIKGWKYFIEKVEQVGEGTFFGDHIVLTIALIVLVDIVALVLYITRKKD